MTKFIRMTSLILALLMLLTSFVACNDEGKDKESEKDTTAAPVIDSAASKLPDMDWRDEEFLVLGHDGTTDFATIFTNFEIARDEFPEDIVGQAIYNRNAALQDKYGFVVAQELSTDIPNAAQLAYDSGNDLYDLILYRSNQPQAHAQSGYLLDLNDESLEYINFDHPAWNPYINEQLTISGTLYYTTSDFTLQDKHRTQFIYYNRELAEDLQLGYFEDMVDNNTWVLEEVERIVKAGYADIDGISGPSPTDRFGLGMENFSNCAALMYCAGFRITEKDANGYPKLVGATDKMLNIIDSVFKITTERRATYVLEENPKDSAPNPAWRYLFNYFLEGNILMITEFTSFYDEWLYMSDIEIGVLPNPKYDSKQERYSTFPNIGGGSFFAIPYTADPAFATFCLQALTEASTDTTYTTYIDVKCKYQDAYDADCARMLDLCFDGVVYDIGAFCNFGELHINVVKTLQQMRINLYKRLFDENSKAAQIEIDEMIAAYEVE